MKLNEVLNLYPGKIKHPEIKIPNAYNTKLNFGADNVPIETKDVIVRDTKTGTIYGRRTIVQRVLK